MSKKTADSSGTKRVYIIRAQWTRRTSKGRYKKYRYVTGYNYELDCSAYVLSTCDHPMDATSYRRQNEAEAEMERIKTAFPGMTFSVRCLDIQWKFSDNAPSVRKNKR